MPNLPAVLWVHFRSNGERGPTVDHDIAMLPGETREPYVPHSQLVSLTLDLARISAENEQLRNTLRAQDELARCRTCPHFVTNGSDYCDLHPKNQERETAAR